MGIGALLIGVGEGRAQTTVVGASPVAGEPTTGAVRAITTDASAPLEIRDIAILGVLMLGLVLSVSLLVGLRLYRTASSEGTGGTEPLPDPARERVRLVRMDGLPLMLVATALAVYIAQMLGGGRAIALLGLDLEGGLSFQDSSLVMLGGYVGGVLGLVFAGLLAPGVGRLLLNGLSPKRIGRDTLHACAWFLLVLPLVLATTTVANMVWSAVTGEVPDAIGHTTLRAMTDEGPGHWAWWLTAASVTIGAPLIEEVMYRGCLQSALRRFLGGWGSIVGVSTLFALGHIGSVDPRMLPMLCVLALGMGLLYDRTGRLWPCMVVHAIFNAVNIVFASNL